MTNSKQSGNIVEWLIIGAVLIGAVALIAWRINGANNAVTDSANANNAYEVIPKAKLEEGSLDGELLFKAPKDWIINKTTAATYRADDPSGQYAHETSESATITSPKGDVYVNISTGGGGVGGACVPGENHSALVTSLDIQSLPNDASHKFVTLFSSDGGAVMSGIQDLNGIDLKNGSSMCDVAFSGFLMDYHRGIGVVTIQSKKFDAASEAFANSAGKSGVISQQQFNDYINSADFKAAKDIVFSIHTK
jgi:hypothetical protein